MPPKKKQTENLTPLIQRALNGENIDADLIAHAKSQGNKKYKPGVDKFAAGLAALNRERLLADPSAAPSTLTTLDHGALLRRLADGALADEHATPIRLQNAHEFYGAKSVTAACLKITAEDPAQPGVIRHYLDNPTATQAQLKAATLAPAENLTPLIQRALNGENIDADLIAHAKSQGNQKYKPGVDKFAAGLAALNRERLLADPSAAPSTLTTLDHGALLRRLADGALADEHATPIRLQNADEFNGAKSVTAACLKITAEDPAQPGVIRHYLDNPTATQAQLKAATLAPAENLTPLIQRALNGENIDADLIAHAKSQGHNTYKPGVDKFAAGLAALNRERLLADPSAAPSTLTTLDHGALLRRLADGALADEHATPIRLQNAHEFYGAKSVTAACLKITAEDPAQPGVIRHYLDNPTATQAQLKAATLAPAENLTPLIQRALNGENIDADLIAHAKSQGHNTYKPGVDKFAAGLAALNRERLLADPSAAPSTLTTLDHGALLRRLADGALADEHATPIRLQNAHEFNGAKSVTAACLKITAEDPAQPGVIRHYLDNPTATQAQLKAATLAPAENLTPLIQRALNGENIDADLIAHAKSQGNKNYKPGVDKFAAGLAALNRERLLADPSAAPSTLTTLDHGALLRRLADGALADEHATPIRLQNAHEFNGAKSVTAACLKITAEDPAQPGVIRHYLDNPTATQAQLKAATLAPAENLTPLIQRALNGENIDADLIAHAKSQGNKNYKPGVDKFAAGLAALNRERLLADPSAAPSTLTTLDHGALLRRLADGALADEHATPIRLQNAHEFNGAKSVTAACLKITAEDPAQPGVIRHYLDNPTATQAQLKAATLAPAENLTPLIQRALNGENIDADLIAHAKSQGNKNYKPGVDKFAAGLAALNRERLLADPSAAPSTLTTLDHGALLRRLADGALADEHATPIRLQNADEFNGAKSVTAACLKITAEDPAQPGVIRHYLDNPTATQAQLKAATLAPAENLTPLIQRALNGENIDADLIAHAKSQGNKNYKPGVDKFAAGLAALNRERLLADPSAAPSTLTTLDHGALLRRLADGALADEHATPIRLQNADEFNGAKSVTAACLKITAEDPAQPGVIRHYLDNPTATQKSIAGLKNPFRPAKISSPSESSLTQEPPQSHDAALAAQLQAQENARGDSGLRQAGSSTTWDPTGYTEPGPSSASESFMSYPPASVSGFSQGSGAAPPPSSLGTGSSGKRQHDEEHQRRPRREFRQDDDLVTHPPSSHSGRAPYPGREQMSTHDNTAEFTALLRAYQQVRQEHPPLFGSSYGGQAEALAPFQAAAETPYQPQGGAQQAAAPPLSAYGTGYPQPQETPGTPGHLYPYAGNPVNSTLNHHWFIPDGQQNGYDAGSDPLPVEIFNQQSMDARGSFVPAVLHNGIVSFPQPQDLQQGDASLLAGASYGTYPPPPGQERGASNQGHQGWLR